MGFNPKKLLISVLSIVLALVLIECGLRSFWRMSALEGDIFQVSADKVLRYEHVPGAERVGPPQIKINEAGFRDHDYPLEKPPGVKRIVVLGDSEVFSEHLQLNETLPKQLELMLNEGQGRARVEVLNLAVIGYTTPQETALLKTRGLAYDPDLVLLYYVLNDPDSGEYYTRKNFFIKNFLTARYVTYKMNKAKIIQDRKRLGIDSLEAHYEYLHTGIPWQGAQASLYEMADLCQARGIPLAIVINTELSDGVENFAEGYPFWKPHAQLLSLTHPNLTVLDPIGVFQEQGKSVSAWRTSPGDSHKNAEAHALVARYVSETLETLGVLQ